MLHTKIIHCVVHDLKCFLVHQLDINDMVTEHLPTVTAVVRGSFGRHCWTMQLRHQPQTQKVDSFSSVTELCKCSQIKPFLIKY